MHFLYFIKRLILCFTRIYYCYLKRVVHVLKSPQQSIRKDNNTYRGQCKTCICLKMKDRPPRGTIISCACGCGEQRYSRDVRGRPRRVIDGHQGRLQQLQRTQPVHEQIQVPITVPYSMRIYAT